MTSVVHEPMAAQPGEGHWASRILVREMWATLAISVMWLAVLFDGVFGSDIRTYDAGGSTASIPSAVVVAFFALLGTVAVARRGFGRRAQSTTPSDPSQS